MALPLLMRAMHAGAPAAALTLVPELALACPYCAGRSQGSIWTNVILGAFVFLPFLVSWTIYRVVKANDSSSSTPATESRRQAS
jgi:hypothetical protein